MIWIYVAAAVFGGGFIIPALIGALDFDTDVDIDFDTDMDVGGSDVDVGGDLDADVETGENPPSDVVQVAGGVGEWLASLLSFRSFVFTTAFFGAAGTVFTLLDYPAVVTFIIAVVLGLFAGVVNARLMAYLKRSDTSGGMDEHHLRGSLARVVLLVGDDRRGRVELDVAGQPLFMSAQPYKEGNEDLRPGTRVVVVEVARGTAYVMTSPELDA